MTDHTVHLKLRQQALARDAGGHTIWQAVASSRALPAAKTALLLCDVWDSHWCRGARERLDAMIPRMNEVVRVARHSGIQIIHAPSDTMDVYADTAARQRAIAAHPVEPPLLLEHDDPPLPIDDSDGGSDTGEKPWHRAWRRQHAGIEIDQSVDGISDSGVEVYSLMQARGIEHLLIAGVHTNMCVLNRSFAIKQMVRWGVDVMLVRDLTDAMYNPAMPPYVDHDRGTQLVIGYIEKFWCPTIHSEDLLR